MAAKRSNAQKKTMETGIVKVEDYRIVEFGVENLYDLVRANVGASGLNVWRLDRVNVGQGNNPQWVVPSLEGEQRIDELVGVIVKHGDKRSYWETGLDEGEVQPPDCSSNDTIYGQGNPGEGAAQLTDRGYLCRTCRNAQFGSAIRGRGQACKQSKILLLYRPTDLIPLIVSLAPTSLGNMESYMMRLMNAGLPIYSVLTGLSLEIRKGGGNAWPVVNPRMIERLDPSMSERFKLAGEQLESLFAQISADDASAAPRRTAEPVED